ncbi:MAG: hypothetical protein R3B72_41385 [Polyangiaceae bacterium]
MVRLGRSPREAGGRDAPKLEIDRDNPPAPGGSTPGKEASFVAWRPLHARLRLSGNEGMSDGLMRITLAVAASLSLLAACKRGAPDDDLMARARAAWAIEEKLIDAFPDPTTLEDAECPTRTRVRRLSWSGLCQGDPRCREGWLTQTGLEPYQKDPQLHRSEKRYLSNGSEMMTEELRRAVEHFEAATHIEVARITHLRHGRQLDADTFSPGAATVWVVTFDKATREVVCARHFEVTNSKFVEKGKIPRDMEERIAERLSRLAGGA